MAAGLDCAGAVAAACAARAVDRAAAVSGAVVGRIRFLDGGLALADEAPLGDELRLGGAVVLLGVLRAGVRRPDPRGRASAQDLDHRRRPACLDRTGTGQGASVERLHDGEPGAHAISLAPLHSNRRHHQRLRRRRAGDSRRGVPRPDDSLGWPPPGALAAGPAGGIVRRDARLRHGLPDRDVRQPSARAAWR